MPSQSSVAAGSWELDGLEREERAHILSILELMELLKDYATQQLALLMATDSHHPEEANALWKALAVAYREIPPWTVAYYLMAFGAGPDRFEFCFRPERREQMIDRIFIAGGFFDDLSRFVEVPL